MKHDFHLPFQVDAPLLSHKEVERLIINTQNGCEESRNRLIECNLKLVLSIVQRFHFQSESAQDLFQIGVIGLMKAINYFDVTKGFRFSTYAVPTIIGEIKQYLREDGNIKISRTIQTNAKRIKDFRDEYLQTHQKEPSMKTIKEALELNEEQFHLAMESTRDILSISEAASKSEEQTKTWEESIPGKEDWIVRWVEKEYMQQLINQLTDKEKEIIKQRYYFDKTQKEVGTMLGISQVQVSRIEKSALLKLRTVV